MTQQTIVDIATIAGVVIVIVTCVIVGGQNRRAQLRASTETARRRSE
jgi:hypothetical protein